MYLLLYNLKEYFSIYLCNHYFYLFINKTSLTFRYLPVNVFNSSSNFSILDDKLLIIADISFIPSNNTELN